MQPVPHIDELAIVAALAVAVSVVLSRLKLPAVAGLLASGAIAGPHGLGLVHSIHTIEALAEVGVVLLLFSIGLEFSLARLQHIFRQVALGGIFQVGLTVAVTAFVSMAFGQPAGRSVFYGFVFALSSTAIVLRALSERRELDAPHGRFIVGTLIFQDLCVVPMVLIVPHLGTIGSPLAASTAIGLALGKAALVVVAMVGVSRFVVPRVLDWVDASRSRETFLLAILGICIGTAWLTSLAGLSLALGAFLGGMVVADTEYGHRALGDVLPLRDALVSVFFVSLGMLFDVGVLLAHPLLFGSFLGGFLFVKGLLATLSAMAMRFPSRVAWLAGVGLAQFGEFGFVLAKLGETSGIVDAGSLSPLLAAGIASMFLTPVLVRLAPHVTAGERLLAPLERLLGVRSIDEVDQGELVAADHVVVIGYGVAGRLAARSLRECGIAYVGLELNAENVRAAKAASVPFYYGDATSEEALRHAHLPTARAMVVLINDALSVKRIIDTAKRVAPQVPIITRAHYLNERAPLFDIGARDVVAEEVEGAIEVISRVLRWVEVPRNVIDERIHAIRVETQSSERRQTVPRLALGDHRGLEDLKIETMLVREGTRAALRSPVSLELRSKLGALIVAVRRRKKLLEHPDPTRPLEPGDVAYLVGRQEAVERAVHFLDEAVKDEPDAAAAEP